MNEMLQPIQQNSNALHLKFNHQPPFHFFLPSHEHQEDTVYTEESQDEQECHSDGNYDENEEEQGVLQHKWENEDPAQESEEETVMNKELKAQMSNLVKFINFLNRLMEDHQNFVNSDINAEVIKYRTLIL